VKCPKCSYTSFDYLRECKRCGESLVGIRESLNLKMDEPVLFIKSVFEEKELEYDDETVLKSQTVLSGSETLLSTTDDISNENESFPVTDTAESEFELATEIDTDSDDTFEFSSLGSMDTIQTQPESEVNTTESVSMDQITLETNNEDDLYEMESSQSLTNDDVQKTDNSENDLEGLDIGDLELFATSTEEKEPTSQSAEKDDITLDLDDLTQNSEFDLGSDVLETNTAETSKIKDSDDGVIALELDMDDDLSLDDLLADLENKSKS